MSRISTVFDTERLYRMLFRYVSNVGDLPAELLRKCRRIGWSDEEIVENLGDAVDFLNARFWCDKREDDVSLSDIFREDREC